MKNGKRVQRVPIGARPPTNPQAEAWVRVGEANDLDALARGKVYTARLTLDVTPALRGRIKVAAFTRGITVADMLRALLAREFPEQRP
ncbi:chromosome partitioning protein ParB [Variovorax sp. LT1R16]|uniref:chromosome partitioning protein ParB n=1 Tax=Variovorax sp. LT1R16 TaxID=3443728 RepID=UPI003F4790D1